MQFTYNILQYTNPIIPSHKHLINLIYQAGRHLSPNAMQPVLKFSINNPINIKFLFTHIHTHTHIYIYIYILKCSKGQKQSLTPDTYMWQRATCTDNWTRPWQQNYSASPCLAASVGKWSGAHRQLTHMQPIGSTKCHTLASSTRLTFMPVTLQRAVRASATADCIYIMNNLWLIL